MNSDVKQAEKPIPFRRLSTLTFGRRAAALLPNGARLLDALNSPMIVDILDTMDSHESAIFFILGPVQFFKSAVGQLVLARRHALRPRDSAWYAPTVEFAKDFADFKLNPLLDAQPMFRPHSASSNRAVASGEGGQSRGDLVLEDKNKLSRLRRTYCTAGHLLLSANNENDRTGKTFVDIYCDEPHLYEPGWIQQISNRRKDYEDEYTETYMSTGLTIGQTAKGGEAAALWATTDQRLWHVRCPHCQKLFEPRYLHREKENDPESPIIGGLLYTRTLLENGLPDESAIGATLAYQCPRCRVARLPDSHGSRVALSGTADRPRGLYISQNPHPAPRRYGWNFNAIAGRAWIKIVMDFELAQLARARGDIEPLGRVIREHFGGLWNPIKEMRTQRARPPGGFKMADLTKWGRSSDSDVAAGVPACRSSWSLAKAHADLRAWWPAAGFDPKGRPYLIATVDVQRDWFRLGVRAWNRRSQSRLLYTDTITTAGRIAEICDLLGVPRERTALDRRHMPEQVRMWCAQYGWRSLMGEDDKDYLHPDGIRRVISPEKVVAPFQGKKDRPHWLDPRAQVSEFNFAKWACLQRLFLLRSLTANDGTALFSAADDAPDWYFSELDDYAAIPKFKDGIESTEYKSTGKDHTADVEIMGVAVASALNLTGAESIEPEPETLNLSP